MAKRLPPPEQPHEHCKIHRRDIPRNPGGIFSGAMIRHTINQGMVWNGDTELGGRAKDRR